MALGMTLNGADGDTYEAMHGALRFDDLSRAEINRAYLDLIALLRGLDPLVELGIGNSIWYREGFPVVGAFLDTVRHYFDAEVAELDFSDPAAADIINGWVAEETRGKIEEIVGPPIPSDLVMYLINAIYFNGTWTYEFDPEATEQATFTRSDASTSRVRLMALQGELPYASTDGYQAIDLPYGGEAFAMTVVLPRPGVSLDELIESLDAAGWDGILGDLAEAEVVVYLPRFKLAYKKVLNDVLIALGMGIAFSPRAADFSRLTPGGGVYISEVKQKTYVEVDERGTEAAAVTSVGMRTTSVGPPAPPVFRADRPFLFAIRERLSGTILFVGKLGDPPTGAQPRWGPGASSGTRNRSRSRPSSASSSSTTSAYRGLA